MILTCRGTRRGLVRARCSRILLLKVRWLYANAIVRDTKSSTDDLREAVATLTSVEASWRRIFGPVEIKVLVRPSISVGGALMRDEGLKK